MKIKKRDHSLPGLSMTAMPDLIFTILFFFMIATHIRQSDPQVTYAEPSGTSLEKMKKTAAVIDIFIGRNGETGAWQLQVGNGTVRPEDLAAALKRERGRASVAEGEEICAFIRADRDAPMRIVNGVKKALREADILKINYSGTENNETVPGSSQPYPDRGHGEN